MIKKTFQLFFLVAIAVLPVAFAFGEDAAESNLPKIVYIEGSVSVNFAGGEWVDAQKGMALNVDSAIKTGDASYCDIALDKEMKNIISLGPNSDVKLGAAFKQIKISKGRVFSELKNLPEG